MHSTLDQKKSKLLSIFIIAAIIFMPMKMALACNTNTLAETSKPTVVSETSLPQQTTRSITKEHAHHAVRTHPDKTHHNKDKHKQCCDDNCNNCYHSISVLTGSFNNLEAAALKNVFHYSVFLNNLARSPAKPPPITVSQL